MPMTNEEFRARLHSSFSASTTAQARAMMTLFGRLTLLISDAKSAGITAADMNLIIQEEMATADRRLAGFADRFPQDANLDMEA
ncbi:hypothetical protein EBB79_13095 [Parasedimentitalea marina]|uniref:Uncharacterized protein n=1 Tax=Parasedimentitalea marina TaxID=2483033 RepID=A0A3T0N3Z7_9RHOB|nr:hypothetical protein [Parasedimentitalea marina]AZV78714.1 hypothetical protein EBB79_13095 [Parasedimentitalea marina]